MRETIEKKFVFNFPGGNTLTLHDQQSADWLNKQLRDAARYRWLQREIDMGRLSPDGRLDVMRAIAQEDGNALDAAIDAAIAGDRHD